MDILLIGNGFDLAHDLPTTYKDFLDFLEKVHPLNYSTLPSLHFDSFIRNPSNITTLNSIRELCFKNNINNYGTIIFVPKQLAIKTGVILKKKSNILYDN